MDRYSEWLVGKRAASGWSVIDLHSEVQAEIALRRLSDPKFTFSKDSVHPDEAGHVIMARAILKGLAARDVEEVTDSAVLVSVHPHGREILLFVRERQAVMKLAWLSATGHKRPGVKAGFPLDTARMHAAQCQVELDRLR